MKIEIHYVGHISPRMVDKGKMVIEAKTIKEAKEQAETFLKEDFEYPGGVKTATAPIEIGKGYKKESTHSLANGSYSRLVKQ